MAWADGNVTEKERNAVMAAAADQGIAPGSPSYQVVEGWLATRPSADLLASWGAYAVALAAQLPPAARTALRTELVERARHVAEAAGGFFGLNAVSLAQKRVIAEIEEPFQ